MKLQTDNRKFRYYARIDVVPGKGAKSLWDKVPPTGRFGRPVHRDLQDVRCVVPLHREGENGEGKGPRPLRHGREQIGDNSDSVPDEDIQAPLGLRTHAGQEEEARRTQ